MEKRRVYYRIGAMVAAVLACAVPPAAAQIAPSIEIASSPNPVGSGARALGMGGAFIGVADDATAASWNPGGLIQLETPEVSVVGAYTGRSEETAFGTERVDRYDLNYLSAAYPFAWGDHNMVISLNYQQMLDFNRELQATTTFQSTSGPPLQINNSVQFEQEGALRAVSPAFAMRLTPDFSVGVALNIWRDAFEDSRWQVHQQQTGFGTFTGVPFSYTQTKREEYELDGFIFNANLGVRWRLNSVFTLGAVYKTPFTADLEHEYDWESREIFQTTPVFTQGNGLEYSSEEELAMPASWGVGLAARLSDALTVDLDCYITEWSDFTLVVLERDIEDDGLGSLDVSEDEMSPITGTTDTNVDRTVQVRLGGEYLVIGNKVVVPLRAGIFYDPEPAAGTPDNFYGLSLGTGVAYKNLVYDIAYQYRFGNDVRSAAIDGESISQDVDQHLVYMSLIYHF